MSHAIIKENINRLLKERNWKVANVEKQVGTGRTITNIMRGNSKNPTIEVLQSISKAFNVEVQELLMEPESVIPVNLALFSDVCYKVISEIEPFSHNSNLSYNNLIALVKEAYQYSTQLKLNSADINFIKWLVSHHYS
jgi:transcriptional regulator with XRE-family HTH domain